MDSRRWEEIKSAFDAIVKLDDAERTNQLSALGRIDPDLRVAVESLIVADSEADSHLAPLEAVFLPQNVPTPDPLGLAGRIISHFQVREPIGAGGMGVVYRAEDTSLGRQVALKFLLPPYSLDASAKARFLREAHSAAALDHPNLCNVYEVGASEDGRLFLAMTLYQGETLKARLARDGPLPLSEAVEIARQITEGLACAHAAGIVHRDLKPGNVMLLPDGTVKILDFGLAKVRDQSVSETGARFGTVSYMSPEHIRGQKTDVRADLWSLGAVLYEMLTGRKAFDTDQDIAVAHAILHDEPVPPSRHRGELPPALEDLVLRLLDKDPTSRFADAGELLRGIARTGTGSGGFHDSWRWRMRRAGHTLSRNRHWAVAGAAVVVIGTGAYAVTQLRDVTTPTALARTTIAVLPFRNLGGADSTAYLADGLQDEIMTQLLRVPVLKVIGRNSVMNYVGPNTPPLREIARELGAGALVQGSVQVVGKRVRVNVQLMDPLRDQPLWLESYDRTLDDVFAIQSDVARQIAATVGAAVSASERTAMLKVPTEKAQAYLLYLKAKEFERRPGMRRDNFAAAIRLYEQALALDPKFALAHAALSIDHGNMYWLRYDMTPARLARQRAEAEAALRLAPELPQAHRAMGIVHNVGPDTDVRAGLNEALIALRGTPNDAQLWNLVAASHRRLANWERYDESFAKAVELDPRDVDLLSDYGGFTHERMGRFADAIHWYDRAQSLVTDTIGFTLAKAWIHVGWKGKMDSIRPLLNGETGQNMRRNGWIIPLLNLRLLERQPDSVLQLLKEARQPVFESTLSFEPVPLWAARAHTMRGDGAAARAAFDSALVTIDSAIRKWPQDWPIHNARGLALAGLGRRDEALAEIRAMRENFIFRKDLFLRPFVAMGVARIFAALGDANSAVDALEGVMSERRNGLTVHVLRLDPSWDRIRHHQRFRALLAKYANQRLARNWITGTR